MKLKRIEKTAATEVDLGDRTVLYSYSTPVAVYVPDRGYFRTDRFYSKTTSAHINKWMGGCYSEKVSQERIEELARS